MTGLRQALKDYLLIRRRLGYQLTARYTQMLWMGLRTKAAYLPG